MAGFADVRRLALALPETSERLDRDGHAGWRVKDALFVWERPLRRGDLEALGESAPRGPILGVRTADVGVTQALLAQGGPYFTTPHFTGYPAVLVALERIDGTELEELVVEAWLARAPRRLAAQFTERTG